ncbi:hypothetical protein P4H92_20925, partial [Bacillus cereus]|nr:hypothetical protein [Bacillus cereus]
VQILKLMGMWRYPNIEKDKLDQLLHTSKETQHSGYNYFKEVPKSPSITHMKDLQNRLSFITSFLPNIHDLLEGIPISKLKHFAAEANSLDASEIKDFAPHKRYMLLLSTIYRSQITTRVFLPIPPKRGNKDNNTLFFQGVFSC